MDICFSLDNNYAMQLGVCISSILKNIEIKTDDRLNFYVLDAGISTLNKKKIETLKSIKDFNISYIKVDEERFKNCPFPQTEIHRNKIITIASYYRLVLPSLFPNLDKMLYLDVDTLVLNNLVSLYNTDIEGYYAAMAIDAEATSNALRINTKKYFNAGVLILNLKKLREDGMEQKFFDFIDENREKIVYHDQDVLNCVLKDKIKILNGMYNLQINKFSVNVQGKFLDILPYINIMHYAGRIRPWDKGVVYPCFFEFFKYLAFTPWAHKVLAYGLYKPTLQLQDIIDEKLRELYKFEYEKIDEIASKKISELYTFNYEQIDKIVSNQMSGVYAEIEEAVTRKISDLYTFNYEQIDEIVSKHISLLYDEVHLRINTALQNKSL